MAEADNPVMLYSIGKDSSVLLHLRSRLSIPPCRAFRSCMSTPAGSSREMIAFRYARARELGLDLLVHTNAEGVARGIEPFNHGSDVHTDVMKTQARARRWTNTASMSPSAAPAATRRNRAPRSACSPSATRQHRWDPERQRPEPWQLYNGRKRRGESIRVFPLSNWTELDVWLYIHQENIPVVPLYFAAPRPVVERDGPPIMVDDERLPLNPGEAPELRTVRFRTLGCYPLTGAIESDAATVADVVRETLGSRFSERAAASSTRTARPRWSARSRKAISG